jgi:uncharacterized protein DUF1629
MTQQRATAVAEVHEYRPLSNNYDSLLYADDDEVDRSLDTPWGQPMAADWVPIRVYWSAPDFPVGEDTSTDFPSLQSVKVMTPRAADALRELIEGRVELLPLDVEGGDELYAINVLRESDALDEEASELKHFPTDPSRIMRIVNYVFDPKRLAGETIFRLAQQPRGRAYITDAFVRRVRETGLRGLELDDPVWTAAVDAQPG